MCGRRSAPPWPRLRRGGFAPAVRRRGAAPRSPRELDGCWTVPGTGRGIYRRCAERRMPAFSNMTQILALIHRGTRCRTVRRGIGMLAADPSEFSTRATGSAGSGFHGDPSGNRREAGPVPRRGEAAPRIACDACWAKNFCAGDATTTRTSGRETSSPLHAQYLPVDQGAVPSGPSVLRSHTKRNADVSRGRARQKGIA